MRGTILGIPIMRIVVFLVELGSPYLRKPPLAEGSRTVLTSANVVKGPKRAYFEFWGYF